MKRCLFVLISMVFCLSCTDKIEKENLSLWFNKPAEKWTEGIPIGNGRLGGMVYGGVGKELIQTNEDTFWSGEPRDVQNPSAAKYLPEIRQMLLDEKNSEAQTLINSKMLGPYNECYMPFVDIILEGDSSEYSNYHRNLDLNTGVVTISYTQNGVNYKREIFSSFPDQAIIIRLTSDKKGSLNVKGSLNSQIIHKDALIGDNTISIKGVAPFHTEPHYQGVHAPVYKDGHGMRFEGRLSVTETDGEISSSASGVNVNGASSATFVFVGATSYNGFDKNPYTEGKDEVKECDKYLAALDKESYKKIKKTHINDYEELFGRVSLNLGDSPESKLPLNERIANYKPGMDPSLTSLYFQFGRYLLISASRPGSQPSNLQGIWNHEMQPAWSSNWTINCNTQLNYWPVDVANLSECHLPLFDMIREATVDGSKTAKNLYNSRGWMAHHNLDIWRTTWPVGGSGLWAIFQTGGAWLCQHIWDHYEYTQDKEFLKEYYPILRDACLFYVDNLQEDKEGYLVTIPSESFENGFKKPNGETGWACVGSAQDMQIIRSLYERTLTTIDILGESKEVRKEIQDSYDKLAPMKISPRTGELQEWNDDWEPANPGSGQVGHGWGFVASNLITLRGTPELAAAFRKTIEYRKPGYTYNSGSWTGAFPANYWARFEEGDSVQRVIDRHFDLALFPNFTSQFFGAYWEIDGNLGMTAAIAQMLLQSHAGEINLLPALASKYPTGSVIGLRARGGYEVDICWKDGKLIEAKLKAINTSDENVIVRYGEETQTVSLKEGDSKIIKFGNI